MAHLLTSKSDELAEQIQKLTQARIAALAQESDERLQVQEVQESDERQVQEVRSQGREASTMLYSNSMVRALAVVFMSEQVAMLSEFSSQKTHRMPWMDFVQLESVSSK